MSIEAPNSASNAFTFVGEKILRIPFQDSKEPHQDRVTRGESIAEAIQADPYIDQEPSVTEWLSELIPSRREALNFGKSLFPFTEWLPRYNLQWFIGDLVAGVTVGCVVVPQSGSACTHLAVVYNGSLSSQVWHMPS